MAEGTQISDAPDREYLRADEIVLALGALSQDDKWKLDAAEAILRRGTGLGKGDLLHDAICCALDGKRHCPREVPFMAFLVMTMKGIASHARKRNLRTVVAADPPELAGRESPHVKTASSAEDEVIAISILRDIYGHLEDDEEATLVLMGWAEELRGEELREATGLDQSALDYAAKRIRAVARKLYPDGWKT